MYLEQTMQFTQWLNSLPEAQRFIGYVLLYIGLPALCFLLWAIDKKINERKEAK